ncbi:MAG TPA: adenylate/guanylate cyclase domain-containing protein [Terriglobia bacterium]|nr:adenylate/guanylate cyclase domain-containing protein [Terriglobia bacterium]
MKTLSRWAKQKWVQALGLGLASALAVLGAARLGWFKTLENKSLDWRFRTFTSLKPSPDVVIIAVDDQSFDSPGFLENFGRFPPRRLLYAGLVHYLHEWGAKAIAFDIFFQGKDPHEGDDELLAQALRERPDVVLGFTLNDANWDSPALKTLQARLDRFAAIVDQHAQIHLKSYSGADLPEDSLTTDVPSLGCATVYSDADGPVRRVTPLLRFGDRLYPSLSLAVASLVSKNKTIGLEPGPRMAVAGHQAPLDDHGEMLIRWYGPPYVTFKHYSAMKVVNAELEYDDGKKPALADAFKDKIVLIAVTAVGGGDVRPNAFSENYPGVEIHATLISNFLNGNFMRAAKPRVAAASAFFLAFLVAALVYSFDSALVYSLLSFVAGGAYFGAVCWFFRAESLSVPLVVPLAGGGTAFLAATLTRYATEGREKLQYRKTLMKYISPTLVETIMSDLDWASLRAEKKTLTVLFSDIRGFTTFSEQNPAETVVATLNEHLNMMVSVIFKYQGTLDKFVGDCVMAFWGAPLNQPNHAELAARAGLEMIAGLEKLNEKWQSEGRPTLHVGVGINTGEMLFGNIGSEQRMDFTVIGDSVNLGSRLESATKELHVSIVISEATYSEIQPLAQVRPLGEIHVKGKEKGIVVYELLGMNSIPKSKPEAKLKEVAS